MTLHEWKERINRRDFFFAAVILLVAFASFGLGRLSKLNAAREGVSITPPLSSAALGHLPLVQEGETEGVVKRGGQVVASKSGTKYHFPWCEGASQIAEKNKVWFSSIGEARKAGYTPASNCKGLQ